MAFTRFSFSLLYLLVFFILLPQYGAAQSIPLLVSEYGTVKSMDDRDDLWFFDDAPAVRRFAPITTGPEVQGLADLKVNEPVVLNIFDHPPLEALIERVHTNVNGTITFRGVLADHDSGYFLISTTKGRSLATIVIFGDTSLYRITSDPHTGQHYLLELNRAELDELHEPAEIPPPPTPREREEQQLIQQLLAKKSLGPGDHATIDVMVLYTPASYQWALFNEGGIENTIAQAMAYAQLVSDRSELRITYRMVYSTGVDYTESSSAGADLRRLTARPDFNPWGQTYDGEVIPGFMYEVHTWRNHYGADLVAMFPLLTGTGGLAWQLMDAMGRPDYGFSLTRVQQASWTYTHIHEMGHNMGAHHHKEQNVQPGPGLSPYSAGWRWTGSDNGRYASVMTYESGQYFEDNITHNRTPYFSNPQVNFRDVPTGHPEHGDNARTLREIKHVVANYRSVETLVVEGYVYDETGAPMARAAVAVKDQGALMYTEDDGYFSFAYLPQGDHLLSISKEGYYTIESTISVFPGETITREFQMMLVVDAAISGFVASKNDPQAGIDGALIRFSRDDEVYTAVTDQGSFMITDIPGGYTYNYMVTFPGYLFIKGQHLLGTSPETMEHIFLEKAFLAVEEIRSVETDHYIDISWSTPSFRGDYRHDGGTDDGGLGYNSATNSLLGGAYRRHAWIERVSWLPTATSTDLVHLRILALNADGTPNRNRVIYKAPRIYSAPGQWNHYDLEQPVHAPYGFFIGVGGAGSFFLRTDEYNFSPGTNFLTSDIDRFDLADLANSDFNRNFYIRARGYDFGPWLSNKTKSIETAMDQSFTNLIECFSNEQMPTLDDHEKVVLDEPLGYLIYLDDFNTPYTDMITTNSYRFTGLPHDRYYVGVQTVYADGLSEIMKKTVFSGTPRYRLTLKVVPDEVGIVVSEGLYQEGRRVKIDAISLAGYVFSHWENEYGVKIYQRPVYEFFMPGWDVKLTAIFEEDPMGLTELKVYPNPTRDGRMNIVSDKVIRELRLVNLMGQVIYQLKNHDLTYYQIRVRGGTEGMYILQVRTDDGWSFERIQILQPY